MSHSSEEQPSVILIKDNHLNFTFNINIEIPDFDEASPDAHTEANYTALEELQRRRREEEINRWKDEKLKLPRKKESQYFHIL